METAKRVWNRKDWLTSSAAPTEIEKRKNKKNATEERKIEREKKIEMENYADNNARGIIELTIDTESITVLCALCKNV